MPVHRHLDDELEILRNLLLEMTTIVDEQLAEAINAVSTCDVELAARVRANDDAVDALEIKIDRQCERILALQTPVAIDLRLIITAIKINTDLERIGDHAKNMAKYTPHLQDCKGLIEGTPILKMADVARRILRDAQDAFVQRDRVLARQVLARDREVDSLYDETFRSFVGLVKQHPDRAAALAYLVTMAKAIERIADHAKNIAESVIFLIEGLDIRHRGLLERTAE